MKPSKNLRLVPLVTLLTLATVLAACGGGGGGGTAGAGAGTPAAPVNQSAEGLWQGTTDGQTITAAVLENGDFWGLVTTSAGLLGFINGTTSVSGTRLSGTSTGYNLATGSYATQTLVGTVATQASMTITAGGSSFTATYRSGYDQPAAPLTKVAGTYSGWAASVGGGFAPSSIVSISSTGQISSPGAPCSTVGTIQPRASGKNLYDVTLRTTGAACTAPDGGLFGVASYDDASGTLIALTLNGGRTDGLVFSGTKQSASSATFPLRTAYRDTLAQAQQTRYTISGTCSGLATETRAAAVPSTFEWVGGSAVTSTLTGRYDDCTPASFTASSVTYYDIFTRIQGEVVAGSEYAVATSAVELPESVVVGDTGQIGTLDVYASSAKTSRLGTRVLSYVIEPGPAAGTAVVNLIARTYGPGNQLQSTSQSRYRLTTTGQVTVRSKDAQVGSTRLVFTAY